MLGVAAHHRTVVLPIIGIAIETTTDATLKVNLVLANG
jgi:hypothetical protein